MPHPLVTQLRFSRSGGRRVIDGVTAGIGAALRPDQSDRLDHWTPVVARASAGARACAGEVVAPEVTPCGFGEPACDLSFDEMGAAWQRVTSHKELPMFVGDIAAEAPNVPEPRA